MVLHCVVTEFADPTIDSISQSKTQSASISASRLFSAKLPASRALFIPTEGSANFANAETGGAI